MRFTSSLLIVISLSVAAAGGARAQTVRGMVVDDGSNAPIAYATVSMLTTDNRVIASTVTDSAGRFQFEAQPGFFQVRAEHIGYATTIAPLTVRALEPVLIELRMAVRGIPLEPLVVRARGGLERGRDGFDRRLALGKGVFLTADSIALRKPIDATDAFRGVKGVVVRWNTEFHEVFTMHGNGCLVIYVDHVANPFAIGNRPRPGSIPEMVRNRAWRPIALGGGGIFSPETPKLAAGGVGIDMIIDPRSIQGIEIYRDFSEVPRELKNAFRISDLWPGGVMQPCGLAWVWTKAAW
jgi:hypothetical protein